MARTSVTEADLGLEVTDEELAATAQIEDDDISLGDDPVVEPEQPTAAEPEKPAAEKPAEEAKTVDLRALQEARAEAREAKQQAKLMEDRWNAFLAGSQQKPATSEAAPEIPKFSQDPVRAGEWTQEQLVALIESQKAEAEKTATQQREEQEFRAVAASVVADYETYKASDPTVEVAYNALRESQGKELLAMGYTIPEAKAELDRLEREHIKFVAARGLQIGDYLKALASARGWQPTAVAAPAKTDLKAVADAQQRHQSLSDAPGGEAVPPLDAKALARMSDKEFKAWMSKKGNEAKFDEIMGR